MADTEALQAKLFAEMKGRIKEDDAGVPAPDGAFAYYSRFVAGGQHPLFCRKPSDGGEERILLDGNALASAHAYFRIAGVTHSPDHTLVAYAVDTKGSEFYTVNVIEADTGKLVDSRIADSNGSLEWAADSRHLLLYLARRRAPPPPCAAAHESARRRPTLSSTSKPTRAISSASARRRTGASSCSASRP